jgi:dihydrofolate reductase
VIGLRQVAQVCEEHQVRQARAAGWTWAQIATALEVSPQAVPQRMEPNPQPLSRHSAEARRRLSGIPLQDILGGPSGGRGSLFRGPVICVQATSSGILGREVRLLRYSINVTLDGCCDHRAIPPDEDLHRHAVENLNQADALLFGRVTYEMMESAWRPPAPTGARSEWMEPFAQTIDAAKKYVVSGTLEPVGWNAELLRGDLGKAVQQLKRESGKGLLVGGVKLPLALTELGLIDEYEFVVHPRLAGHGPTLFAGLSKHVDLKLVSRLEFGAGAVAMRYEPTR